MPATLDEVKRLFKSGFAEADTDGLYEDGDQITGIVRSPEFHDMDIEERHDLISKRVRDVLRLDGMNVGLIYALDNDEQL